MADERKQRAEARLADALARKGLADTRPVYRQRLRLLRETHPTAFEQALAHYDDVVLPALAGGEDAVDAWIAYGGWLAELTAPGGLMGVDEHGRARPYHGPYAPGQLVLHVPKDGHAPVLALTIPAEPSRAQQATHDLLVAGRVTLES